MTDLQGLLIGKSGEFTEAVEAFEVEGFARDALLKILLPASDLTRKVRLANAIGDRVGNVGVSAPTTSR